MAPFHSDPEAEHRGDMWTNFYIPRDERFTMVKTDNLQEDAIQTASRKLIPALQALYSNQTEFERLSEIADLFKNGIALPASSDSESDHESDQLAPACETILTYPTPKVIAGEQKFLFLLFVPLRSENLVRKSDTLPPKIVCTAR